jgi:hypothetical protein
LLSFRVLFFVSIKKKCRFKSGKTNKLPIHMCEKTLKIVVFKLLFDQLYLIFYFRLLSFM